MHSARRQTEGLRTTKAPYRQISLSARRLTVRRTTSPLRRLRSCAYARQAWKCGPREPSRQRLMMAAPAACAIDATHVRFNPIPADHANREWTITAKSRKDPEPSFKLSQRKQVALNHLRQAETHLLLVRQQRAHAQRLVVLDEQLPVAPRPAVRTYMRNRFEMS